VRIHVIPVFSGHSPEESWALIQEHADGDEFNSVPDFERRIARGERPMWANIETLDDGRLVRVVG
jgi:hypothetical protein